MPIKKKTPSEIEKLRMQARKEAEENKKIRESMLKNSKPPNFAKALYAQNHLGFNVFRCKPGSKNPYTLAQLKDIAVKKAKKYGDSVDTVKEMKSKTKLCR